MPREFFASFAGNADTDTDEKLACNPTNVCPKYLHDLGRELTALRALLFDAFSVNPGRTGEAILEPGVSRVHGEGGDSDSSVDDIQSMGSNIFDDGCSNSTSQARAEASDKAKNQDPSRVTLPRRPVDVIVRSLQTGFGSIE
ncbi:hypothetical protein GN244_ATG09397 [Phytophthora infestans]|uniref:Uncharacterized protein n=1 Tax=Phytophthora infestans TaxID=4787 RepID=A0A833T3H6_PHYIN|nr:hypothetical protein GN244_ATG09397 [Phytophthora infestans]KAF4138257.1 hypothetical protein GN958_ATG12554 [Phytophthora infestans]KAF4145889.1 hypothetical protein GN958_ATG04929 [Phytophthora infestans]